MRKELSCPSFSPRCGTARERTAQISALFLLFSPLWTDLDKCNRRSRVRNQEHRVERVVVPVEPLDSVPRVVHELAPRRDVEGELEVARERVRNPHEDAEKQKE